MLNSENWNKLTLNEEKVIINKGTEAPFIGEFTNNKAEGVYVCKQCELELFLSDSKFDSGCGWPSFDSEISNSVGYNQDADGFRTEIVCSNCKGHLGHVFNNEGFTTKNVRHCVNSISLKFIKASE